MAQNKTSLSFALDFAPGRILFTQSGGAYFLPPRGTDAFIVWGERKELFGKNAIDVRRDENNQTPYAVVYEFANDGALLDARLVGGGQTLPGRLTEAKTLQALKDALDAGTLKLHGREESEPIKVFNVAEFPDGRLLVQLHNRKELYLGTPGNYAKLDAQCVMQGGNSLYYKLSDGGDIALPYGYGGPRRDEPPMFRDQELAWRNDIINGSDPKELGLDLSAGLKALNPFSPELAAKPAPGAPKPPAFNL